MGRQDFQRINKVRKRLASTLIINIKDVCVAFDNDCKVHMYILVCVYACHHQHTGANLCERPLKGVSARNRTPAETRESRRWRCGKVWEPRCPRNACSCG